MKRTPLKRKTPLKARGKKYIEWQGARLDLIGEYRKYGITVCEGQPLNPDCWRERNLTFHHLDKRSSGRADHSFKGTRLLCPSCHTLADSVSGFKEFNRKLRELR